MTNWGREDLTTDLTADDDSIQIVAFFSVPHPLGDASITTNSIGWRLDYGDAFLEGTTDIEVEDHDLDTVRQSSCSRGKKDKRPYNISTIERGSL